jgi:hypothetical protein
VLAPGSCCSHRQFERFSDGQQQIFFAGVEAFSAGAASALVANYDFDRNRRVLDVGGGTGSFLIAILRRFPALQGTLFELPGTCTVARRRLNGEFEGSRIAASRSLSQRASRTNVAIQVRRSCSASPDNVQEVGCCSSVVMMRYLPVYQRRKATQAQMASMTPNGHAPCRSP